MHKIKFTDKKHDEFYTVIRRRADVYFAYGHSTLADMTIWLKAVAGICVVIISYYVMLQAGYTPAQKLLAAMMFGMAALFLALNIAHDGVHDCLFKSRVLNKIAYEFAFSLIGASGYLWGLRHIRAHHVLTNISGRDHNIDGGNLLRLSEHQPYQNHFKYQHIYAPLIYCVLIINIAFTKDIGYFFEKDIGNTTNVKHQLREYIIFALAKIFYVALWLIIPLIYFHLPSWMVLSGYLLVSSLISLIFVILQVGIHLAEEVKTPGLNIDGNIDNSWVRHTLQTTMDWNADNKFVTALVGGLNAHLAHHFFPAVSHRHNHALTKIIYQTADEYGVEYKISSFWHMLASHFRYLKRMGRMPAASALRGPESGFAAF